MCSWGTLRIPFGKIGVTLGNIREPLPLDPHLNNPTTEKSSQEKQGKKNTENQLVKDEYFQHFAVKSEESKPKFVEVKIQILQLSVRKKNGEESK